MRIGTLPSGYYSLPYLLHFFSWTRILEPKFVYGTLGTYSDSFGENCMEYSKCGGSGKIYYCTSPRRINFMRYTPLLGI